MKTKVIMSVALALLLVARAYAQTKSSEDLNKRTLERRTVEALSGACLP